MSKETAAALAKAAGEVLSLRYSEGGFHTTFTRAYNVGLMEAHTIIIEAAKAEEQDA